MPTARTEADEQIDRSIYGSTDDIGMTLGVDGAQIVSMLRRFGLVHDGTEEPTARALAAGVAIVTPAAGDSLNQSVAPVVLWNKKLLLSPLHEAAIKQRNVEGRM